MTEKAPVELAIETVAQAVSQLSNQVAELQEIVGKQRIQLKELRLWQSTGNPHKYCRKCFRYVKVFSSIYMEHTDPIGGEVKCPNSLKPWSE